MKKKIEKTTENKLPRKLIQINVENKHELNKKKGYLVFNRSICGIFCRFSTFCCIQLFDNTFSFTSA